VARLTTVVLRPVTWLPRTASASGGGKTTEQYLDQILGALSRWYNVTINPPGRHEVSTPQFTIGGLYVAGHSGGGTGIRTSIPALGGYKELLRECWGFDCLYAAGQTWFEWAKARGGIPLSSYFGDGTRPPDRADVLGFWSLVYDTLKRPLPPGQRMLNAHLAPSLTGTEPDRLAFRLSEDIKAKARPGNRYEEVRLKVDPLLGNTDAYWSAILKVGLFNHDRVVSDLLGPRISRAFILGTAPGSGPWLPAPEPLSRSRARRPGYGRGASLTTTLAELIAQAEEPTVPVVTAVRLLVIETATLVLP
jgi:hypothetical protein